MFFPRLLKEVIFLLKDVLPAKTNPAAVGQRVAPHGDCKQAHQIHKDKEYYRKYSSALFNSWSLDLNAKGS